MQRADSDKPSFLLIKILYSSGLITLIFLLIKALGFIEKLILANFFGTGDEADAYLLAYSIPYSLFIIVEEIISPVFVPFLVERMNRGESPLGLMMFKRIINYCLLTLLILSGVGIWQSSWIVSHLAPGFQGAKLELTIRLCQSLFITLLFLGGSSLLTVIFHAHKKFNLPVWAHAVQKLLIILGIVVLHSRWGIYGAVIGCIVGAVLRAGLLYWRCPVSFIKKSPVTIPRGMMTKLWLLMLPLLCGVLFSQMSALVDNVIVSKLEPGSIAALSYARKIVDLPVLMVPFAIGIVLLPYFSLLSATEKRWDFAELLEKCIKILLILFLYLTILVFAFSNPLVKLLFERGQFDATSTHITAVALAWFSLGLIAFAIEIPIMQSFFALKDTTTPITVGIACVIINIILTITLVHWLGYIIVPLALALQKIIKVNLLLLLLTKKVPLRLNHLLKYSLKLLLCGVLTYVIVVYFESHLLVFTHGAWYDSMLHLGAGSLTALAIFVGLALLFRITEVSVIILNSMNFIRRQFHR